MASQIVETSVEQQRKELRRKSPEQIAAIMAELDEIKRTSEDWIVPASHLSMVEREGAGVQLAADFGTSFPVAYDIGPVAHRQIAEKMGIPQKYYDRCPPSLLATNVNHWMGEANANYMIRTVKGRVRALLSDRFRPLDSYDYSVNVATVLQEVGAMITDLSLSEERFYIRAIKPEWGVAVDNGRGGNDVLIPGFIGSNSDVGLGGVNAASWALRTICMNGAQIAKSLHKVHVGERFEGGLVVSNETREAKNRAIWLEIRDLVRATFDRTLFAEMMDRVNDAARTMLDEPTKVVERVADDFGLSEAQTRSVLDYLMAPAIPETESGTLWGLVNGVTRLAHEADADGAAELERIGGELLERGRELVRVRR